MNKKDLHKRIQDELKSGFGLKPWMIEAWREYGDYKPSIAERIMFRLIKGRELKDSDYKIIK